MNCLIAFEPPAIPASSAYVGVWMQMQLWFPFGHPWHGLPMWVATDVVLGLS